MADLYVDMGLLRGTRTTLSRIAELRLLDAPCRELKSATVGAAGHEVLRKRLESFADEWGHGIGPSPRSGT